MIQVHSTFPLLKKIYPTLIWEKETADEIFLTFDDGPHPEVTPWVLQELNRHDAKATFFCVGSQVDKYPDVARMILSQGSSLANHTQQHENGWQSGREKYLESFRACDRSLANISNQTSGLFRPPYGRIKKQAIRKIQQTHSIVMWSHLAWDFKEKLDIGKSIRKLKKAKPGSIVLFHDNEKSFKNLRQILPVVLAYWSSLNLKFKTL